MCLHLNPSVRMSELSCYEAGILMERILGHSRANCQSDREIANRCKRRGPRSYHEYGRYYCFPASP